MSRLITISTINDILPEYRNTPIELLIEYHNLSKPFDLYKSSQLLIGMCMDNRKHLNIPKNFAHIIRSGGANMRYNDFKISYAISLGKIRHIALIGHNNCGMVNLDSRKEQFISGLVDVAGWNKEQAEDHFKKYSPIFEIGNEIDFILSETKRLRTLYPKIQIASLMYLVEDNRLYFIKEKW